MLLSFLGYVSVGCQFESALGYIEESESSVLYSELIDLLLLVHAQLARTHVDQEKETADNRQNLEKVTTAASGYQRAKVMTIDVVNRRVVVEASANKFVEEEEDDAVPEPVSMFEQAKSTSISGGDRHGGRGGAFALNPLLRLGENPTFIPTGGRKTAKDAKDKVLKVKAEQKPKPKIPKLQYDDGGHAAVMQDAEFSFSSGGDSQSVLASIVEPSCG